VTQNPSIPLESQKPSRRLRWITVSLVILTLAAAVWHFVISDGPMPDDRLMIPHWTPLDPSKPNALAIFFGDLDTVLLDDFSKLPKSVQKREPGSESEVHQFVTKQQPNFAVFDRLMATDPRAWQWPGGEKLADLYHSSMDASYCGVVAQVLRMKIHALMLERKTEEASSLALAVARFGGGLQAAEGNLFHVLVGLTIQRSGEEALQSTLTQGSPSPALLRKCLGELDRVGPPMRVDMQFAYKVDYLAFKNAMQKMDRRKLAAWGTGGSASSVKDHFAQWLYKTNRTLAKRVELEQPLIEALNRSWPEAFAAATTVDRFADDMQPGAGHVGRYLDSNSVGISLLAMSLSASSSIIDKAMYSAVLHQQTCIMLALRLFELEKGRLPARLDELAPEYLPTIPEDAFTGKTMLWDPVYQVVYSVGPNGKDEKGAIDHDRPHKGADIGMLYWWNKLPSAPAPTTKP
jgi:hypothetical protein